MSREAVEALGSLGVPAVPAARAPWSGPDPEPGPPPGPVPPAGPAPAPALSPTLSPTLGPGPGPGGERIGVAVHTSDELSRAGVLSHLSRHPAIDAVAAGPGPVEGVAVAVVLVERLGGEEVALLRRVVRGARQGVVLVVRELREVDVLTLAECGVRAVLWRREVTAGALSRAVCRVAAGDGDLPPDLIGRVLEQMGRLGRFSRPEGADASVPGAAVPPAVVGMAEREVDVLRLIADGFDTRQIAEKLAYSERTVKNVLHGLMTRLRLTNRAHAVAYALREGFI
ncbi:response regulator transcription factor (plasmid) [Streptomyces sp. BI20]|uniref:helix-turn-helix transcriptional regulator n=1 Tax=Streptomyces sp. BI20 TaxID=3403460 RepID=UPI003C71B6C4